MRAPPPAVPAAAFLLLHLLPLAGLSCLWGVDSLAYLPVPLRLALGAAAAALFVPAVRRLARGAAAPATRRPGLLAAVLAAAAAVVFVAMPSAGHLLGDGILHLHDLERLRTSGARFGDVGWGNNNAPLANWVIYSVQRAGAPFWNSSLAAFRFLAAASGVLYVLVAVAAAWRLAKRRGGRALILAFLLTAGWMELFAGYVEMYATLPVLVLLFLTLGATGGERGGWAAAGVLGVLVPMHFATVSLAPALLFAGEEGAGAGRRALRGAARLALAAGIAVALLALVRFDFSEYLHAPRAALLPLGQPGPRQAYRLLAPAHLRDLLDQLLLVAPAAVAGLVLLGRRGAAPPARFLGAAALGALALAAVANPEVGAFRDWDALAFAGIPFTVWVAVRLATSPRTRERAGRIAFLLGGAAALHTVAWLALNTDAAASERRFVTVLGTCPVSVHAQAYGWESVARLRLEEGRRDEACAAFLSAAAAAPDNPRYWEAAGQLHVEAGRPAEAEACFRRALRLDPDRPESLLALGVLALARGSKDEGRAALTRFLEIEPRGPKADEARRLLAR